PRCLEAPRPGKIVDSSPSGNTNLVIVSFDALRADHVGAYGCARDTTPNIDRAAARAAVMLNARSNSASTLPSHSTLFASLYFNTHGAQARTHTPLPSAALTLAEVLKSRGYATAAFTGGAQMHPGFGTAQGFDPYAAENLTPEKTADRALRWLDAAPKPFFLFIHTYEIHHPYVPPPPYNTMFDPDYDGPLGDSIPLELIERVNLLGGFGELTDEDVEHIAAVYDGEVRYTDSALAPVLRLLRGRRFRDDTMLILLSDHGEEFGEHGYAGWHSHSLYEELLRVPLIIAAPGVHPSRIAADVSLIDVTPTALEYAGVPPDRAPAMQGRSFLPLLLDNRESTARCTFAELEIDAEAKDYTKCVVSDGFKFIGTSGRRLERMRRFIAPFVFLWDRSELYDLEADPGEKTNLIAEKTLTARRLEAEITAFIERTRRARLEPERPSAPGDELRRQLKSLGYTK
ncbi:MAG: sulfatase, partial [bacterium]